MNFSQNSNGLSVYTQKRIKIHYQVVLFSSSNTKFDNEFIYFLNNIFSYS